MKNKCPSCGGTMEKEECIKMDSPVIKGANLIKEEKIMCKDCKKTLDKKA